MTRRLGALATVAGWALLTFTVLYLAAHVLYALGLDPLNAAAGALGLCLGLFCIAALFLARRPAA